MDDGSAVCDPHVMTADEWRRRLPGWIRRPGSRWTVAGAGVVVAVLAGAWWMARGGGEPGLSPGQVVTAFFQAQRDGDCRRVVDLVSEASWSDGGERTRGEFLDQCDAALDGYQPAVDRLEIGKDGDRVTVANPDSHDLVFERDEGRSLGRLVREEGRWRIRLDDRVLHLGPSPDEVVRGYLDAYNQADCRRLAGFLSESLWPAGVGNSAELTQRCEREVDDRRRVGRPYALEALEMEVSVADQERAELAVSMQLGGEVILGGPSAETVRLVREGLRWRLAAGALPDGWAGAPLRAVAYAELEVRLVDEVVTDTACSGYSDQTDVAAEPNATAAGAVSIARSFPQCDAQVGVYRFADEEAARGGARSMADAVLGDPLPTAGGLDATEAEVPGMPDALGVRGRCDGEGCSSASAYAARGPMVVAVTMEDGDLEDAAGILAAQLERL